MGSSPNLSSAVSRPLEKKKRGGGEQPEGEPQPGRLNHPSLPGNVPISDFIAQSLTAQETLSPGQNWTWVTLVSGTGRKWDLDVQEGRGGPGGRGAKE